MNSMNSMLNLSKRIPVHWEMPLKKESEGRWNGCNANGSNRFETGHEGGTGSDLTLHLDFPTV
jgi:hypothetical protein